jgi:hypothetical protein
MMDQKEENLKMGKNWKPTIVGGTDDSAIRPQRQAEQESPTRTDFDWRSRERIQQDIEMHVAARVAYGKAVAWEAAAESENLPPAQIEEARKRTAKAFEEMRYRGLNLVVVMPTDRRALVDLLLYLEKNFSILPQEVCGRSLAVDLLRTMRLSLRRYEKYGQGRRMPRPDD